MISTMLVRNKNIWHDNESNKEVNRLLFCGVYSWPVSRFDSSRVAGSNIYSAMSNVTLKGGKFYKMKRGTCYTIINDLTSVAKQLPRMPTVETTAIRRHWNTSASEEYTHRPHKIFLALTWLKTNIHLHAQIELVWPNEVSDWLNGVSNIYHLT